MILESKIVFVKMRNLLLALIFVHTTEANNATAMKKLQNCKNINCSTTENPVCIHMYDKETQIDLFIVAINDCEVKYAKCEPGIKAIIVPMKNCKHNSATSKKILTRKNRVKRQSKRDLHEKDYVDDGSYSNNDANKYSLKYQGDVYSEPASDKDRNNDDDGDDDNQERTGIQNSDRSQNVEENNDYGVEESNDRGDDENLNGRENGGDNANQEIMETGDYGSRDDFNNIDTKADENQIIDGPVPDEQEIEEDMIIFDPDYDKTDENEVNFVEYKDNCPKQCPAREVMVCARCRDNIYRTFPSVCHLRMFHCKHPNEKLELVSRRPCMLSSPFLTDFPAVEAKLKDPAAEDVVLKFIHCREKGRLKRDPRCKFRRK